MMRSTNKAGIVLMCC